MWMVCVKRYCVTVPMWGWRLDGDGDRLIMVDERGQTVDGDEILAIIAHHRHSEGKLQGGVVGTLMSNLGLEKSIQALGCAVLSCQGWRPLRD